MRLYLLVVTVLFSQLLHAQVDPRKLDSLQQTMMQSQRSLAAWQDSFTRRQDSIYRSAINRAQQAKEPKEKEKGATYIAAGSSASLLMTAYISWYIRRQWWL